MMLLQFRAGSTALQPLKVRDYFEETIYQLRFGYLVAAAEEETSEEEGLALEEYFGRVASRYFFRYFDAVRVVFFPKGCLGDQQQLFWSVVPTSFGLKVFQS